MKVQCKHHPIGEATCETESNMHARYPKIFVASVTFFYLYLRTNMIISGGLCNDSKGLFLKFLENYNFTLLDICPESCLISFEVRFVIVSKIWSFFGNLEFWKVQNC